MAIAAAPCPAPAETGPRPTFVQIYTTARSYLLPRRRHFFSVDPADIEDLVHDTVVVAHHAIDRYQAPSGVKPEVALLSGPARRRHRRRRRGRAG
jgi:DNA-directed RNA polymerase specialized sigma24 family protein